MKNLGFALILLFTLSGLNAQNNCLVLDMPFNGNSNDISGNNYHGKVINAKLTSDRFGNKNSAYFFDGNSAWIDIENPKKLNDISEQFTISAWFKPETGNYYNTIIAHGGAHFFLQLIDELNPAVLIQGVEFGYEGADSYFDRLVLSQTISESKWTHLVCTFNNSNQSVKIYLNGNLLYKGSAKGKMTWKDTDWRIGARISANFAEYFHGAIDDVKAFNCVLDSMDVKTLFDGSKTCNAEFEYYRDSLDTCNYVFINKSETITNYTNFYWTMGDDSNYELKNVEHKYSGSGPKNVTLYMVDSIENCYTSESKKINVKGCTNTSSCNYTLNGQVITGNSTALHGVVYLISKSGNNLKAIDTVIIDSINGYYTFSNVCKGEYFVKAALLKKDKNYSDYTPTYYGFDVRWDSAEVVSVYQSEFGLDVELLKGYNKGGRGFIGGNVKKGANKKSGDMLDNIQVIVTDNNWSPVQYTFSDENGLFEFEDLANGTYYVFTDAPGKYTDVKTIIISDNEYIIEGIDINVYAEKPLNISYNKNLSFGLFPNPTSNNIIIQSKNNEEFDYISIIDIDGKEVYKFNGEKLTSKNINLTHLNSGLYLVRLKFANGSSAIMKLSKF